MSTINDVPRCVYCDRRMPHSRDPYPHHAACADEWRKAEERRLAPRGEAWMRMASEYEKRAPPRPMFD